MDIEEHLSTLESRLGYSFRDRSLLRQALTHRSHAAEHEGELDNENLEFLGDAVLELAVSEMLYRRFAGRFREGDLTKMRAYLVSEPRLAERARALDLGNAVLLSSGEEKSGGRSRPSILSDVFEAVTGAIFLDGGMDAACAFLKKQFDSLIDSAPEEGLLVDFKSRLQELIQKRFHFLPTYRLIDSSGPDHKRYFEVGLFLEEKEISRGSGHTKKEAEQRAARAAMENLEEIISRHGH